MTAVDPQYASSRVKLLATSLCLLVLSGFYLYWGWSPILGSFYGDNAVYWMTANYWSPYGTPIAPAQYFAETSIYPPLYPLTLAAFGGGVSVFNAHLVTTVTLILAFTVVYAFVRSFGLGWVTSLALVCLFASARVTLLEALQLHSEHLYILLSYGALYLVERGRDRATLLLAAAACVACAYFTRTFGLTLALSFIAYVLLSRQRPVLLSIAVVVAPIILWSATQSSSGRYLDNMFGIYAARGVLPQLAVNFELLWMKWLLCFADAEPLWYARPLLGAVAACCLAGVLARALARRFDGLYAASYLGLLAVWPYPAEYERMLYPILPLILAQATRWLYDVAGLMNRPKLGHHALTALVFAILVAGIPHIVLVGTRLTADPGGVGIAPYKRTLTWYFTDLVSASINTGFLRGAADGLIAIRENNMVPADDCILSIKPSVISLYSHRRSLIPPSAAASDEAFADAVDDSPCRYAFIMPTASPTFPIPYYPYERLKGRIRFVAQFVNPLGNGTAAALLVRILPTESTPE